MTKQPRQYRIHSHCRQAEPGLTRISRPLARYAAYLTRYFPLRVYQPHAWQALTEPLASRHRQ